MRCSKIGAGMIIETKQSDQIDANAFDSGFMMKTPTVSIDITTLRRKESAGERPAGLADRALEEGRPVNLKGRQFAVVLREWWEAQIAPERPESEADGGASGKLRRAIKGAASTIKTQTLRRDRVSDEVFEARLAVCASCSLCIVKDGKPHSCGPMLEERKQAGAKTCGCVLKNKARDAKQDCPNGWWPSLESYGDDAGHK